MSSALGCCRARRQQDRHDHRRRRHQGDAGDLEVGEVRLVQRVHLDRRRGLHVPHHEGDRPERHLRPVVQAQREDLALVRHRGSQLPRRAHRLLGPHVALRGDDDAAARGHAQLHLVPPAHREHVARAHLGREDVEGVLLALADGDRHCVPEVLHLEDLVAPEHRHLEHLRLGRGQRVRRQRLLQVGRSLGLLRHRRRGGLHLQARRRDRPARGRHHHLGRDGLGRRRGRGRWRPLRHRALEARPVHVRARGHLGLRRLRLVEEHLHPRGAHREHVSRGERLGHHQPLAAHLRPGLAAEINRRHPAVLVHLQHQVEVGDAGVLESSPPPARPSPR